MDKKMNRVVCFILSLPLLWVASYSCGGTTGASSPITPAQIPSSIEYAGGEVSGDIVVQMGKSLNFNIKDADGAVMTDLTGVTLKYTDAESGEEVSDGSCGTDAIVNGQVVFTAPADWPNVSSKCSIEGVYNDAALADISAAKSGVNPSAALSGTFRVKVTIEPTVADTSLTFATLPVFTSAYSPDMAIDDDGVVYICYRSLEATRAIYFSKSADTGSTWSTPVKIVEGQNDYSCSIAVRDDNVAVTWRHSGTRGVDNTSDRMAYSADGGATFGSVLTVVEVAASNTKPYVVIDSNGVAHIISTDNLDKSITACSASSCGTSAQITTNSTAVSGADPRVAIASDDTIYVVWRDSQYNATYSDVYISQITYNGTSHTVGTNTRITDSTANSAYVLSPAVVVNRSDAPAIAWAYMGLSGDSYYSNIHTSTFDPDTGAIGTAAKINDIDQSNVAAVVELFYDAYGAASALYQSYGSNFDNGDVWFTTEDGSGGFIDSTQVDITGWVYTRTSLNLRADLSGRPYVIWDVVTYVGGTLTDSYILIGVGRIQ